MRGVALAAWTLAAFVIGALAGIAIRRVIPAMFATFAAWAGLDLRDRGIHGCAQVTNYQPDSRFWPFQWFEGGWLLALSLLLIATTVWLVRRRAT